MIDHAVHAGGTVAKRRRKGSGGDAPRASCLGCRAEVIVARESVSGDLIAFDVKRPDVFTLCRQEELQGFGSDGIPEAFRAPVYSRHRCSRT